MRQEMIHLVEEAKRRYPKGTRIVSPQSGAQFVLDGNIWSDGSAIRDDLSDSTPYIYYKGQWARILSRPTKTIIKFF